MNWRLAFLGAVLIAGAGAVLILRTDYEASAEVGVRESISAAVRLPRKDAIVELEKLLSRATQEEDAYAELTVLIELAHRYRKDGRTEDAIAAYRLIDSFPPVVWPEGAVRFQKPNADLPLAQLACREAPYAEGIERFDRIIKDALAEDRLPAWRLMTLFHERALCLEADGRPEEAIDSLVRLVERLERVGSGASRIERFTARDYLARAYARQGDQLGARRQLLAAFVHVAGRRETDAGSHVEQEFQARLEQAEASQDQEAIKRVRAERWRYYMRQQDRLELGALQLIDHFAEHGALREAK